MRCNIVHNQSADERGLNLHQTPAPRITRAYLLGVLHDSTERKYTLRISQKSREYIEFLASGVRYLGFKAWIYKEGANRNLYVVEFSKRLLSNVPLVTRSDLRDYVRGCFDSEGSVPKNLSARYYIYFAQKDFVDLDEVRSYLALLGVSCGSIHTPSRDVDPNYFRFFVLRKSQERFGKEIGSRHPEKLKYLRMKI